MPNSHVFFGSDTSSTCDQDTGGSIYSPCTTLDGYGSSANACTAEDGDGYSTTVYTNSIAALAVGDILHCTGIVSDQTSDTKAVCVSNTTRACHADCESNKLTQSVIYIWYYYKGVANLEKLAVKVEMTDNSDLAKVLAIVDCEAVTPTFTYTPTVTSTNTYTPTVTSTNTNTNTYTPTSTNTYSSTPTNTYTPTYTLTPTQTVISDCDYSVTVKLDQDTSGGDMELGLRSFYGCDGEDGYLEGSTSDGDDKLGQDYRGRNSKDRKGRVPSRYRHGL